MTTPDLTPEASTPALSEGSPPGTLAETLDRLIGRGVAMRAEIWLTVAGVELVFVGADLVIASADTMRAARERRGVAA